MPEKLTFNLIPRDERSEFDWMNIECEAVRVGKVRGLIDGNSLTIHSINIFPEFEGRGYGRKTIGMFKGSFGTIVADRVRHTAIGFWERMGFENNHDGNYVWKNGRQGVPKRET